MTMTYAKLMKEGKLIAQIKQPNHEFDIDNDNNWFCYAIPYGSMPNTLELYWINHITEQVCEYMDVCTGAVIDPCASNAWLYTNPAEPVSCDH